MNIGFSRINPGGATGYNMAISHTVQNCIKGTDPDFQIDYPSVVFCTKGKLIVPENITMELNGMDLKVNWDIKTGKYSSPDDSVELLIHQPGTSEFQVAPSGTTRNKGELVVGLDPHYKGDTVHVYFVFDYFINLSKEGMVG